MERRKCKFVITGKDGKQLFMHDSQVKPNDNNEVSHNWVSYRLVICHALWVLLFSCDDKTDAKKCFNSFIESLEGDEEKYDSSPEFLDIRRFNDGDVLIIDKTEGCYPLLLHIADKKLTAFKMALKNVKDNIDSILDILESCKNDSEWSFEIEERLRKFI